MHYFAILLFLPTLSLSQLPPHKEEKQVQLDPDMASSQVQNLLRFLSQDAKVPLATAMSKVIELQKSSLITYE